MLEVLHRLLEAFYWVLEVLHRECWRLYTEGVGSFTQRVLETVHRVWLTIYIVGI